MIKEEIRKPLVIISGGAGYLGSAISEEFDHRGWQVVILSRTTDDGVKFPVYACDVTDEQEVENAIASITTLFGNIQVCIHAAATPLDRKPLLATSLDSFIKSINIALVGGFVLAKVVTPHMYSGSSFIGITTEGLETTKPLGAMGAYLCAKNALRGFLRELRKDLARRGIRVYAVAPGFLPGGLNNDLPPPLMEFIKTKTEKMQTPQDVAQLLADICEQADVFPSGTSVTVQPRVVVPL